METGNSFEGTACPVLPHILFLLFNYIGSALEKYYLLRCNPKCDLEAYIVLGHSDVGEETPLILVLSLDFNSELVASQSLSELAFGTSRGI